ncbi:MAG: PilN domain-containing protein [Betaproteobacteria bacterium]|nr:PilN domain-containing protein [Betaproteobacteria bacterium]
MSQQINLFNPIFRKHGFSSTSANSMLYGLGIVIAIAMSYGVYQDYRTRELARQAQEVARQHGEATARREKLVAQQAGQKPNAALEIELNQLEWRLRGRQDIVDALNSGAVGITGGFSDYMRAFSRQTVNGLWLTGFDIASSGNELAIQGRTLSADLVPSYLKRLNQEPALQGRQFAALRISQPKADPAVAAQREQAAKDEKKADAQKAGAAPKDALPALPRYLEFSISTSGPLETGQKISPPTPAPLAASALSQAKSTPDTADVLGAAVSASGGRTETAK